MANVSYIIDAINMADPNKIAVTDGTTSLTYKQLLRKMEIKAAELVNVKVLGITLDNSIEWLIWDLAALSIQVPCVPLPPFFTQEQLTHSLVNAGVSHTVSQFGMKSTGFSSETTLPTQTAKVTFTSGTTNNPRGVCLSEKAMFDVASSIIKVLGHEVSNLHLCCNPLAILLENIAGVYCSLMAGKTVFLPSLKQFGNNYINLHEILSSSKANSIILSPQMLKILMLQCADKGALPDLKFIAVGGAKISEETISKARDMGLPVYQGYGLSECGSVVALNTPQKDRINSVGKVLPHLSVSLKEGEIHIKNPGFLGYVGRSAPKVIHSGDLGMIDAEGYLYINGRKKNVIITSFSRNISPEWVESNLLAHPEILQAMVYGDAEAHLSALIVSNSSDTTVKNIIADINIQLPEYARIESFKIIPALTVSQGLLTGTGRPKREKILQHYLKG